RADRDPQGGRRVQDLARRVRRPLRPDHGGYDRSGADRVRGAAGVPAPAAAVSRPVGGGAGRFPTLAALARTAAILVARWMPKGRLPAPEEGRESFCVPHADKAIHFAMFAGFGALWTRQARVRRPAWVLAAGLALAAISEAGQGLEVVGRDPDLFDGLADTV